MLGGLGSSHREFAAFIVQSEVSTSTSLANLLNQSSFPEPSFFFWREGLGARQALSAELSGDADFCFVNGRWHF